MIEKLKKLQMKCDTNFEKLKKLEARKKEMLPKLLQAEDGGGSDPKLRGAWEKIKNQIETAELRRVKLDDALRPACENLIDFQMQEIPKEQARLKKNRDEILRAAGEMLGQAALVLRGLGPDASSIAPEIFSILQSRQNITLPMIEGWQKGENAGGPRDQFQAKKILHDRLKNLPNDPIRRSHLITKYAGACQRGDFEYLEGR